jgi:curved DNA-binding protein CbpA
MPSPYAVIDVPKTATTEDIKRQSCKLALQFHPDKNSDPRAKQRFVEIHDAYDQLMKTALTREKIPKTSRSSLWTLTTEDSSRPPQSMENYYRSPNPSFCCMNAFATNLRFESHEVHNIYDDLKRYLLMYGFGEGEDTEILDNKLQK